MNKAIYSGSFDPITNGHLDIIQRAAKIFDEVIIAISTNTSKNSLFSSDEKFQLVEKVISDLGLDNVTTVSHPSGLTVDFAAEKNAQTLIRGIRSVKDLEYEMDIASMNKTQNELIETVFLIASEQYRYLSSSLIKEIAHFDGDLSKLVPEIVAKEMKEKMDKN